MSDNTLEYKSTVSTARRWRVPGELGLVVVILIMGGVLSVAGYINAGPGQANTFLNPSNLIINVATPMSFYSIMAVGMTFVIISGGIDISVGSMMGMAAWGAAWVLVSLPKNLPGPVIVLIALVVPMGIGLICGLINGALVVG